MSLRRVYIGGAGILTACGNTLETVWQTLLANHASLAPLTLFAPGKIKPLPVGQVRDFSGNHDLPRCHQLALAASRQAMQASQKAPDAIILGSTTGGMLTTEELLKQERQEPHHYRHHSQQSVTDHIARQTSCRGPLLTVSTACSSGAVALFLALAMLRRGEARCVLAGGVDSLCRLTYHGFNSLQLVDAAGCRPFDAHRRGMAVAEGAAMLLLTVDRPEQPLAELAGGGLSCDAYHPAAPHPEGAGALTAMQAALQDAGLRPAEISAISLHGTATPDNDRAEALAIRHLFASPPPLASIKGATGHSLAAAGAVEAVISALSIRDGLIPPNTGFKQVDPTLQLRPLRAPLATPVTAVLSNSFGFGGNNASLVLTQPNHFPVPPGSAKRPSLFIHGYSCLTGAGLTAGSLKRLLRGKQVRGCAADALICKDFEPRLIRRLKRLPRMCLALGLEAIHSKRKAARPAGIFVGTGWGGLSESWDFLQRLFATAEQFSSPIDFVGSVHNAPAGQLAIMHKATGANITTSGGHHSFEQALYSASLTLQAEQFGLVLGLDEYHAQFSPLLSPDAPGQEPADGGGALLVSPDPDGALGRIDNIVCLQHPDPARLSGIIDHLGGRDLLRHRCRALVTCGAEKKLVSAFIEQAGLTVTPIYIDPLVGNFATASAVAAAFCAASLGRASMPAWFPSGSPAPRHSSDHILLLNTTDGLSITQFSRP